MKNKLIFTTAVLLLCGCYQNNNTRYTNTNNDMVTSESYVPENHFYEFPEYGFSINSPCVLEDSPQKSSKDLVNIGGFINMGDKQNFSFYQLMVNEMPNKSESEFFDFLQSHPGSMKNLKPITIGKYHGLEGDAITQGVNQKGLFLVKNHVIITLTVISPINLQQKYDDFKNSLTFVEDGISEDKFSDNNNSESTSYHSKLLDGLIDEYGNCVNVKFSDANKRAISQKFVQFREEDNRGLTITVYEKKEPNAILAYVHKNNIVSYVGIGFNSKPLMYSIFEELRNNIEYVGRSYYPPQGHDTVFPTYKYNGYYFQKFEDPRGGMIIISKTLDLAE